MKKIYNLLVESHEYGRTIKLPSEYIFSIYVDFLAVMHRISRTGVGNRQVDIFRPDVLTYTE